MVFALAILTGLSAPAQARPGADFTIAMRVPVGWD